MYARFLTEEFLFYSRSIWLGLDYFIGLLIKYDQNVHELSFSVWEKQYFGPRAGFAKAVLTSTFLLSNKGLLDGWTVTIRLHNNPM